MLDNLESLSSDWVKRARVVPLIVLAILMTNSLGTTVPAKESLSQPTGKVILTVTGAIDHTNADGRAEFDRSMLKRIRMDGNANDREADKNTRKFDVI